MPGLDQPLELARALIRCPSVTPADAGALDVLQAALEELGFTCHRIIGDNPASAPIDNLYARRGTGAPNFCFAGHTDVVPVGDRDGWSDDPFAALVRDGKLFGRGASDMKGAIAAFVAASARFLARHGDVMNGSISLLITGDEEGPAINGTRAVLDWLPANDEQIDLCLVGEPTNPERLGDMIKIGRRGSLNARLTVFGTQGHAAYPALADNPLPRLVAMMGRLTAARLDDGNAHFQPSNIQITTIDVGNEASNVTPAKAQAAFNIRFNDGHNSDSLTTWLRAQFDDIGGKYELDIHVTGEAFLTPPGELSALISEAVEAATGRVPELSTTGGTSDARFIKDHCAVAEFGLIGRTMHKIDEHIELAELDALADIYEDILTRYFTS
ncbi:MAG: Succinyl-diaminopimelate desuccinylase [Alphaproteobacteria bacterium MarineAlpha10_Bin1]|nr:MAG: Succinyl-diaminopimelate desuccinylase [Alphaproteobacteria bacterium MarineAlpha10_Bin1]